MTSPFWLPSTFLDLIILVSVAGVNDPTVTLRTDHPVRDGGEDGDGERPHRHDVAEQLREEVGRHAVITTHVLVAETRGDNGILFVFLRRLHARMHVHTLGEHTHTCAHTRTLRKHVHTHSRASIHTEVQACTHTHARTRTKQTYIHCDSFYWKSKP